MTKPSLPFCENMKGMVQSHMESCPQCQKGIEDMFRAYPVLAMLIPKQTVLDFLKGTHHGAKQG